MLGSLCTGLISSSAKLCLPHSGLLRHAWLKDDQFQKNCDWVLYYKGPQYVFGIRDSRYKKGGESGF